MNVPPFPENHVKVFMEYYVKVFMEYYRTQFPKEEYPNATILPKMHLLEDHMADWLRQHHLAAGLKGEQGAESIHADINKLEMDYKNTKEKLHHLKNLFEMYTIETDATLLIIKPEVKPRPRKRKRQDSGAVSFKPVLLPLTAKGFAGQCRRWCTNDTAQLYTFLLQ